MSEYSKEKIKVELHEKYENGEIDDVELKEEIKELVSDDGEFSKPDKTSNKKRKSHPNSLEKWM